MAPLQFDVVPYRPDHGWDAHGLALVAGLMSAGALVLGYVASFLSQWLVLAMLPAALAGGGLGALGAYSIERGRLRHPLIAGVAGLLAGCTAVVLMHFFDYQRFLGDAPPQVQAVFLEGRGFLGYMDWQAQVGVQLADVNNHNPQEVANLGYWGSYAYWVFEMAAAALIAGYIMRFRASLPFCTRCKAWKTERILGGFNTYPGVANLSPEKAVTILSTGAVSRFAELEDAGPQPATKLHWSPLTLRLAECPNCKQEAPIELRLEELAKGYQGRRLIRTIAHVTYPGEALSVFEGLFADKVRSEYV